MKKKIGNPKSKTDKLLDRLYKEFDGFISGGYFNSWYWDMKWYRTLDKIVVEFGPAKGENKELLKTVKSFLDKNK